MDTKQIILVIVVIVIVAIGGYFFYVNQSPAYTNTPPPANTPATVNPSANQPQNLSASVSIKNFAFNPTPLSIKVGTTVTWTNNDSMAHQIKSATFNSAALSNGQSFQFTFSSAGQYNYSCAIHPSMLGKIIVSQ